MKIKKFEKYNIDIENGDIPEEYAKLIVSQYIDTDLDNISIEDIFADIIKSDQLYDQADIIKQEMLTYIKKLFNDTRKIRSIEEIDAQKYNI
jgi:deoxyxylulose-5-phosphate synthase